MTRLAIERGPTVALPRRFLHSVAWWGVVAAALLWLEGEALLRTRWHPAALALTHAFTLGVLGNAMFGSVLQFLPAAAGVRLHGVARFGGALHALLNLGVALLCAGLYQSSPALLLLAAIVLPTSFVMLVAMTLPGVLIAHGQRLLHIGIGAALLAALLTTVLGMLLASALAGRPMLALPLPPLADVHAAWGTLGWVLLLIASVARVVMPMFQGSTNLPASAHAVWLAIGLSGLLAGSWLYLASADGRVLRGTVALCALTFALTTLVQQSQAPRSRGDALRAYWRCGLFALVAAALALLSGADVAAAVLGIGIGLPLLTIGMLLQICAFLAWIDLHRRCGRGVRLPGVQRLLPEADKLRVLWWLLGSGWLLSAAAVWPGTWLARAAAVGMLLAYLRLARALHALRSRADRFVVVLQNPA